VSAAARRSASARRQPSTKARRSSRSASACINLCFRARERADIDELHGFLQTLGAKIIRVPREDQWAPGYYSILFEDPDGIRLELNHVPGKGLLA
jgi:catechol 2,3-dioxygenase-like lactoylglutathione lyase family enzyme